MPIFKPQPQPNAATYPLSATDMCPRLTRAMYRELLGTQAPAWDPKKQIKRWFDDGAAALPPDDLYVYSVNVWRDGKLARQQRALTNAEAAAVNLPGKYDFPKYTPKSSGVYVHQYDDSGTKLTGKQYLTGITESLSLSLEAVQMKEEMEDAGFACGEIFESSQGGVYALQFDPDEKRRLWYIMRGDKNGGYNVGRLLVQKYAYGVGAPGSWVAADDDPKTPVWRSSLTPDVGEHDTRPEIPCPQRTLLANEEAVYDGFTGQVMIRRVDNPVVQAANDAAAMPVRVREILEVVKEILAEVKGGK